MIYCIGGWNGQSGIRQCDVFNPLTDKWTSVAQLNTGNKSIKIIKNKINLIFRFK